jgi:phage tail-like protein
MPATDQRNDPLRGFNFRVEIDGLAVAAFSEVSGLMVDGDTTDYREGTDRLNSVRKLAGLRTYKQPIVLKRGYTKDDTFWQWYARTAAGEVDRRNGSVILMNEAHKDVMRWNFENAFLNKIEGPALKAADNAVTIESAELVHEFLSMELEPA